MAPEPLKLQCFVCAEPIPPGAGGACSLVLTSHWDAPALEQRHQQFFCHSACFRMVAHPETPLYLFEVDEPAQSA